MGKYSVAIIILSDKGSKGEREDLATPTIKKVLSSYDDLEPKYCSILPDDFDSIVKELNKCIKNEINLILTSGGTGFSPRDVTPEATKKVIEKEAPGVAEAMRASSMKFTKRAMLSRGICGIKNKSIILNLPGSPKACKENLESVIESLLHGIDTLIKGSLECARK